MSGHARQSAEGLPQSHWHTWREPYPQATKGVVHHAGLERKRAFSDPVPHRRQHLLSGWLRHSKSMPVNAANAIADDCACPPVAAGSRQSEPATGSTTGNTRDDSGGVHAAIGKPTLVLVHEGCTAPMPANESPVEPERLSLPRLSLSPSAGSMKITLVPRLSHQHTSFPTHHATGSSPHKSTLGHINSHSHPRLTLHIPQKQFHPAEPAIDMATTQPSPPPTKKTSPPRQKRVSFTTSEPEIIPTSSKRRQSSVNQRPSWSNVFLLRDSKVRDDVAARSRSLSPGPSILKEVSAFKSDASDAELKKDEHGNEVSVHKVHISPLYEKNLKRLSRGRPKTSLPIPQAKVSRNASPRAMSPERDLSPTSLSARHASPREDTFEKAASTIQSVVVHPPSPPDSDAEDDDEEAVEDSDEQSPRQSRNSSLDDLDDDIEVETIASKFSKCDIDGSSHAHRHEPRKDSLEECKGSKDDWRTSRKSSNTSRGSNDDWRTSRKSSNASRKSSATSRKDSQESNTTSEKPPTTRRRSSSADQAEMWLRRSSIYGVRSSRAPRVPTRLGSLRA